ncbi:MAG: hypothetical protein HY904_00265 [Deltaproteobacteria bacterium]|nr:hypothetical protein [Deltaproteobacteria bacterium]
MTTDVRPRRGTRLLVGALFLGGLGVAGMGLLDALSHVGKPFPNFGYTDSLFVNPVLFAPAERGTPEVALWDRIVSYNGTPVTDVERFKALLADTPDESHVELGLVAPDGRPKTVRIAVQDFTVADFFRWHTNQALLSIIIIIIGGVVFLFQPGGMALTFGLTCLATSLMLTGGVDGTLFHRFPHLYHVSAPLLPAAGMAFARQLSPRLARRRRSHLVWSLPLGLGVLLAGLAIRFEDGPVGPMSLIGALEYVFLIAMTGLFFLVMLDAWRRPAGALEGARAGVLVLTWPLALGIPALNFLLAFVSRSYEITAVPNVAVLLMPASVAWLFFRQDLFEADLALRRLFAEVLITGTATALYALTLGLAYKFYPDARSQPAVAVGLAATLLFWTMPIRDRVKRRVDQLLEGRRYDAQEALAVLSERLSAELSLERALTRLGETLQGTIRPRAVSVHLLRGDGNVVSHAVWGELLPAVSPAAARGAVLLQRGEGGPAPVETDAGATTAGVVLATLPHGVELVIPLRAGGAAVGELLLGPPAGKRPRYGTADLLFARAVAGQVAPTLANAAAFAEVDRLNRTLEERVAARTRELTRANDELREQDRRKDELVSTVSHDFRSPLSIIRSHVDTVLADPAMDAPTRMSFLRVVEKQARRLSAMVENLLDLARIQHREMTTTRIPVADLLRTAADGARPRLDATGVTFRVDAPAAPLAVRGDPDRLGQVFQNLLDNAARFTPAGGTARLYAAAVGGTVTFGVADTGIGIPAEDQARVCEPFYQVKRAGAERDGSGLGLAIVREIVERHGARLRLSSGPGGTTWEFDLPVAP